MCMEGWCVGLEQEGGCLRESENCLKYLKKVWNRKEGSGKTFTSTQVFSCEFCKSFKKTYFEEHL